jgi:TetR/AcrR family transcriptional regulator, transcriptional repressor for nem operon
MRYSKQHKEATRQRIVEIASNRFRKEGLDAVGVASLMADAGLTHGGFYNHFSSKEDLIEEALISAAQGSLDQSLRDFETGGIAQFIRSYLRTAHRDHPESGCSIAALAGELPRHSKTTREVFTKNVNGLISLIESRLPKPDPNVARAICATLVGTLQLARAVSDKKLSDQLLKAGEKAAIALSQAG